MKIAGFANGMNLFVSYLNIREYVNFITPRVVVKRELAFIVFVISFKTKCVLFTLKPWLETYGFNVDSSSLLISDIFMFFLRFRGILMKSAG